MYGGLRLHIHLATLFNCFIKTVYLPRSFMQSVIIAVLKSKSGDVTDANNYRAIAVSTAISKLFESIMCLLVICINLGSNRATLLGFVLAFLSVQQITIQLVVAMFSCALWISPKPSIR